MTFLIVDDEPLAQQRLLQLLKKIQPKAQMLTANNGKIALDILNTQSNITTVFLDIRMPVMDGLETAKHINHFSKPPVIIFTTAYNEFALEAFDLNAIDYLLKPISLNKLSSAIKKATQLNALQLDVLKTEKSRSHLSSKVGAKIKLIEIKTISYFYCEDKYVFAVHQNNKHIIDDTIKNLESELGSPFLRVHRNALVNISQIAGLVKRNGQNFVTLLASDKQIEISRRALTLVKGAL